MKHETCWMCRYRTRRGRYKCSNKPVAGEEIYSIPCWLGKPLRWYQKLFDSILGYMNK